MTGWEVHLGHMQMSCVWSRDIALEHMNYLKMIFWKCWISRKTANLDIQHFQKVLRYQKVLVKTDNTTVMTYINKQGGTHSQSLCILVWNMYQWTIKNNIALTAHYIAGKANILADLLSQRSTILPTEWMLNKAVVQTIFNMWERPQIDLSATRWNSDLCVSISRRTSTISRCS